MAEVWLARDHGDPAFTDDRMVALKILREGLAEDPDALRRFDLEGRSMTRFRHQNIATVFDQVDDGVIHFLVMEYVEGSSLARLIAEREEPLPPGDVVEIVSQVCAGIGYAHRNGVIHRDIKPANVLMVGDYTVDRPPRVKVTDFGIALAKEAVRATRTGGLVGSLPYMAPEVLLGVAATEASDVYGCGALLYELLTGRRPYPGSGLSEIAAEQRAGPPPDPAELVPRVPTGLAQAVLVALSYRPDARFLSIEDLWGRSRPDPAVRTSPPSCRRGS
jgi:serine/threonine-protein kinase